MISVPLMLVSSRSSTTTSGLCCSTSLTTSVPSVVQAATLMSGSPSSSARRPSITMAWSSASSTRIMVRASFRRQRDGQRRPAAGRALERERAAQHLHAILNAAQPEVSPLHAHVLLARQHPLRLEAAAVVRDGQGDRQAPPLDAHALPRGARVPVAVRERLLQDPVDRDLRGQGAVAQLPGQLELHCLLRQRLVLDGEALDDLAQLAPLEPGGAEGADEVADLAERALEQQYRLSSTLRCSSRSLVASRRRDAARASASRTSVTFCLQCGRLPSRNTRVAPAGPLAPRFPGSAPRRAARTRARR